METRHRPGAHLPYAPRVTSPDAPREPLTSYQKKLFAFLGVASFFEGYDLLALSQALPAIAEDLALSEETAGDLITFTNIGTMLAFFLVRRADRWGRRRVLSITIVGYAVFTGITAMAPNVYVLAVAQLLARIFLLAEWGVSMVIAAEEYPPSRRGFVIGVIQGASGLGAVVCAGTVPLLLQSPLGWRTPYLVGLPILAVFAYMRREMRETQSFAAGASDEGAPKDSLWTIWSTPYAKRVLAVSAVWFFGYISASTAVTFWKFHVIRGELLTEQQAGNSIAIAALIAMPLAFLTGWVMDRIGRRPTAAIVFSIGAVGVYFAFTLTTHAALTVALIAGIMGAQCYLPVLNAFTTELFPTEHRGSAWAWCNNLLGRVSYIAAPAIIVRLAEPTVPDGPSRLGEVMSYTAVFPIIAVVLVFILLPETKGRSLEETAAV